MLAKRIIPCLDIMNGRTVKGINFLNLKDAGDPVELAAAYSADGADELVFLDITATHDKRKILTGLVKQVASVLSIPFTVGGGISNVRDAGALLDAGADKISVNSAAVGDPYLIDRLAKNFGQQFVVVAIDAMQTAGRRVVYLNGGRIPSGRELFSWTREAQERGAGEILYTSMCHDGTQRGFAVETYKEMAGFLTIPVIASGGAGKHEHFRDVFTTGCADAALAAGIFHYNRMSIPELKKYLSQNEIPVRL
ncbi:MAG: imidazole glycerol phosphate synthase subunit HisF [Bacteroidetes bacterium]|nr:imidazole glycerol phosphate synthase subunit HisF [Bacteroidota bacterium]